MHLTTRTLLSNNAIQQRLNSLAEQILGDLSSKQTVPTQFLTVVAVTSSSTSLLEQFCSHIRALGWGVTVLTMSETLSAEWFVTHTMAWDGGCVLFQDVSSSGETLLNTKNIFQQYLGIPVVSCSMFRKGAPTDQTSMADYIGFSIPDDFIVGCGLHANGKFHDRTDVSVLV